MFSVVMSDPAAVAGPSCGDDPSVASQSGDSNLDRNQLPDPLLLRAVWPAYTQSVTMQRCFPLRFPHLGQSLTNIRCDSNALVLRSHEETIRKHRKPKGGEAEIRSAGDSPLRRPSFFPTNLLPIFLISCSPQATALERRNDAILTS